MTADRAPPRSQSAFGISPTSRFMSFDIPRRSMNPARSQSRLSTMNFEDAEEGEEEEDDEMEREPGYEAEFNRYAAEAAQQRAGGGAGLGGGKGRDLSFGRRSMNLLREGFRMPLRQVSGSEKKGR